MTEEETAKKKKRCFPKPLPSASRGHSPHAEISRMAGTECLTNTISDPHNTLLGGCCYYLHFTDEVVEAQKGLAVAGARWHRQ